MIHGCSTTVYSRTVTTDVIIVWLFKGDLLLVTMITDDFTVKIMLYRSVIKLEDDIVDHQIFYIL